VGGIRSFGVGDLLDPLEAAKTEFYREGDGRHPTPLADEILDAER